MDASIFSIKEFLSDPILKDFLSFILPHHVSILELLVKEVIKIETFMKRRSNPGEEEEVLVEDLRIIKDLIGSFHIQIMGDDSYSDFTLFYWVVFLDCFTGIVVSCNYWKQAEEEQWLLYKELVTVINSLNEKDIIGNLLPDTADCNSCLLTPLPIINEEEKRVHALALLLVKTCPSLLKLKEPYEIFEFLLELTKEMDNLPQLICEACHCQGQPLPLLLIGSLLLLKQCDYQTWNKVIGLCFKEIILRHNQILPSRSFSGFSGDSLKVLELIKCAYQYSGLLISAKRLQYLGLRSSNIPTLHHFLYYLDNFQTLDVRDTMIEIRSEYLWKISTLRHVYINPSLQIKGPPSTSNISNLQTLKTVAVHESWLENFPRCLINLRKLALSNRKNSYWKLISNLLSHMVNLLSVTIIGDIVLSKFVDLRSFPNLETVKSIKFEGEWKYCEKLIIDNVKFPTNLTKLTLTKSGLKEDPMPRLGILQVLKLLRLQDGAYIEKKMVCSKNGFPQLQFLELKKLEKFENWEVNPKAMPRLTKLRVFECLALKKLPNLEHVPNIDTDIK